MTYCLTVKTDYDEGFLGVDSASGGYPYIAGSLRSAELFANKEDATFWFGDSHVKHMGYILELMEIKLEKVL